MQKRYGLYFIERFINYKANLSSENGKKNVNGFGLRNFKKKYSNFKEWRDDEYGNALIFYVNRKNNLQKWLKTADDTFCLYLPNEIKSLNNNKPIIMNENEISKVGREWLELLSIK